MTDFIFDKYVRDTGNGTRIDVTVVDADPDSSIQVNLRSGALCIPFFLSFFHARQLATYLLQACDAYDAAAAPPKPATVTDDD